MTYQLGWLRTEGSIVSDFRFFRRVIVAGMMGSTARAIIETPLEYAKVRNSKFVFSVLFDVKKVL